MSLTLTARRSLYAVVVAGLALIGIAGPASAHDRLVSSDPADGATLDTVPGSLTLEFSADLIDTGTQVAISTAGSDIGALSPLVDGTTVTVPLPTELANATYDVAWRVVSSDGHPIEGTLHFSLAAPEPAPEPEPEPAVASEPASAEPAEASATPDADDASAVAAAVPSDEPSPAPEHSSPSRSPIIGIIAGVAIVGTVVALVLRRRSGMTGFGPPGQD